MTTTGQDFIHYAGNTKTIRFKITEPDGTTAVDLSHAIIARWWLGKTNKSTGADVLIKKSTKPDEGIVLDFDGTYWYVVIGLQSDDTENITAPASYYHEAEVIDVMGEVSTVAIGKCKMNPVIIDPDLDISP